MINLLCIYDYMAKTLTYDIFDISTFSMVLCLFLLHVMEIFPITPNFWEKNIVKHCLTVIK